MAAGRAHRNNAGAKMAGLLDKEVDFLKTVILEKSLQLIFNRRRTTSTRQHMEDLMMKEMMETSTTTPLTKTMTLLTLTSQLMKTRKSNQTLRMTSHLERSPREQMVFKLRLTRYNKNASMKS